MSVSITQLESKDGNKGMCLICNSFILRTEEGGIKENNNLGGAWSIAPWTALDVEEAAAASPTHSPEV